MQANENEIRVLLLKEYIKRNWQNFAIGAFVVIFLTTIILYMSSQSMQKFYYGEVINISIKQNSRVLEVKIDGKKSLKVPVDDKFEYKKGRRVKLKMIQNDMLGVKGYRFLEYVK